MTDNEKIEMAKEFFKSLINLNGGIPFKGDGAKELQTDVAKYTARKYFEIFNEKP